jgi:hypothetical protein
VVGDNSRVFTEISHGARKTRRSKCGAEVQREEKLAREEGQWPPVGRKKAWPEIEEGWPE